MAKNRNRTKAKRGNRPALIPVSAKAFLPPSYQTPDCAAEPLVSIDEDFKFRLFTQEEKTAGWHGMLCEALSVTLEDMGPEDVCGVCRVPGLAFAVDERDISLTMAFAPHSVDTRLLVLCLACLPKVFTGEGRSTIHWLQSGPPDDGDGF